MSEKIFILIPAAGMGTRFGADANKAFVLLDSKPLIAWAIEVFESMPEVSEIIPILKEGDMEQGAGIIEQHGFSKVKRIAPGGKERQDSVFSGLNLIDDRDSIVAVHDGARPLVDGDTLRTALVELRECDGVVPGIRLGDTIKEVNGRTVRKTLPRDELMAVQTPQVFRHRTLYDAYVRAFQDMFYSTDDSALVEKYGGTVRIIPGRHANIKITTPEDLEIARLFLDRQRRGS